MDKLSELKFEEYRTFIEDTGRFTERRQNTSNLYISINSLLLTGLMFVEVDLDAQKLTDLLFPLLIITAGIFISLLWKQLIQKYKKLVGLRINILREMENEEHLSWMTRMYHAEDELYPRDGKKKMLNFSDKESQLPSVFIGLYTIAGIFLLASFYINF